MMTGDQRAIAAGWTVVDDDGQPVPVSLDCVGSGQLSMGPELRQPCPECGRMTTTTAAGLVRAIGAHIAPAISPDGSAPSLSLDL